MRLLAALPHYPPTSRVGAWLATHQLLAHLAARGHAVTVTTSLGQPGRYTLDGVAVRPLTRPRTLMAHHDVVLSHLGGELAIADQARRHGLPHVVSAHGADRFNQHRLERMNPHLLIANSGTLMESLRWDGHAAVLPPTVWPDQFPPAAGGDAITLVNVTEAKGSSTFYALAAAHPHRRFLGVRGGYGIPDERALPNVELIDTVQDMREVYARTRVLLMPSAAETYGMVGIEALCSGIPVLAHPTPGLRESLAEAGRFAHRDDIDAWTRHLVDLDDPDEYSATSVAARARVARLTPAADLDRVADLIESLTTQGADRAAVS
ncbi:MAG: glycosyltransferase family 4 protein [Dehalococcoidia bacterium]